MRAVSMKSKRLLLLAMLAGSVSTAVAVQAQDAPESDGSLLVTGAAPPDMAQMAEGPKVEGIISARSGDRMQVKMCIRDRFRGAGTAVSRPRRGLPISRPAMSLSLIHI